MEQTNATEANAETIASQETVLPQADDAEARLAELEAEKAQILEEKENYKKAYLKEVERNRDTGTEESEDDRLRRIVREENAAKELTRLDSEKEALLAKLAKENKELKLAQMNKTVGAPATQGTHSETVSVQDTLVTPEQMAYFKSKNWTDQDIERYKLNLRKNSR